MSLHPHPVPAVPEETAHVAHAAFPRDNVYLRMRDEFGAIGETLRSALNTLAVVAPEWGQALCPAAWVQRYGHRVDDYHLPTNKNERHAYAPLIGMDGHALLAALYAPPTPQWLRHVPAVETL